MMEDGWSARRVACQLGCSDRVISCREDHHIVRNARVQPTASSATIQVQVAPSLGTLCLLEPYEGAWLKDIWDCGACYVCCPWRPSIDASVWSGAAHEETGLQKNGTRLSSGTNPDSISAVMAVVCGGPRGEHLNPSLALQQHFAPAAGVMVWGAIANNTRSPLVLS
ncbi:uncharacterized protein TNCV_1590711 [Trichonephila clavipes]|nr:uncharacterized protein TNCV_1590711 [Trichonephila clavipes]